MKTLLTSLIFTLFFAGCSGNQAAVNLIGPLNSESLTDSKGSEGDADNTLPPNLFKVGEVWGGTGIGIEVTDAEVHVETTAEVAGWRR